MEPSELFRERCCHTSCNEPACNVCSNCRIFTYCNINGHNATHTQKECRTFVSSSIPQFDYRGKKICVIIIGDPCLQQVQFNNAITEIFADPNWGCYFICQDERLNSNAEGLVATFCKRNEEEQFDFLMFFYNGQPISYGNIKLSFSSFIKNIFSKLQNNIPILTFNYHTLYQIPEHDREFMMGEKRYPNFGTKIEPNANDDFKESTHKHDSRYYQLYSRLLNIWDQNDVNQNDVNQNDVNQNDVNQNIYQVILKGDPLVLFALMKEVIDSLYNADPTSIFIASMVNGLNQKIRIPNKCQYIKPILTSYFNTLSITKNLESKNVKCVVAGQKIKPAQIQSLRDFLSIKYPVNTFDIDNILHNMKRKTPMKISTAVLCDIFSADNTKQEMKQMQTFVNKHKNQLKITNKKHEKKCRRQTQRKPKNKSKSKSKSKTKTAKRKIKIKPKQPKKEKPIEKLASKLDEDFQEFQYTKFSNTYVMFVQQHFIRKISNASSTQWQFYHRWTADVLNYKSSDTVDNEFIEYARDSKNLQKPFALRCEECHWVITLWTSVGSHVKSHNHRENVVNKIIEAVKTGVRLPPQFPSGIDEETKINIMNSMNNRDVKSDPVDGKDKGYGADDESKRESYQNAVGPQFSPSNSNNKHSANFIETINILNIDEDVSTLSAIQLVTNGNINNKSFIVSDVDEQLLILISFKT
eukprot:343668_1